jgi:hypothetical protein
MTPERYQELARNPRSRWVLEFEDDKEAREFAELEWRAPPDAWVDRCIRRRRPISKGLECW